MVNIKTLRKIYFLMVRKQLYKIGNIAKTLKTSLRTIRYYEELGLIDPFRTEKGTRLYSDEDISRLTTALTLREYGLSLKQVAELATTREKFSSGKESSKKILPILKDLQIEIAEKIKSYQTLAQDIERAELLIQQCKHCNRPPTNKGCPNCPVALNKNESGIATLIWDAHNE